MLVIMSLNERFRLYMPLSFVYHFAMTYGSIFNVLNAATNKRQDLLKLLNEQINPIITFTTSGLVFQVIAVISVNYLADKIKLAMSQLIMAKMSMRSLVNHLNEAIFLRIEGTSLSFCNELAIIILKQACQSLFHNDTQQKRYFKQLSSMDFVARSIIANKDSGNPKECIDKIVQETPFLKLYMNSSNNNGMNS